MMMRINAIPLSAEGNFPAAQIITSDVRDTLVPAC